MIVKMFLFPYFSTRLVQAELLVLPLVHDFLPKNTGVGIYIYILIYFVKKNQFHKP